MTRPLSAGAARRAVVWIATTVLAAPAWAPRADAHAVLVRSAPAARATLTAAPGRVQLWFNERLEPAFSSASVWSAAGVQVDQRDARVESDDPKCLSVTLAPVKAGIYTVRYRVLSVDGHVVDSSFQFTLGVRPPLK